MPHTPAPWRHYSGIIVSDTPSGEYKTTAVAYVGEEFRHAGGLPFGDDVHANGALIAAAPDLYRALDNLMDAIGGEDSTDIWCKDARAALAKATGQ